MRNAWDVAAESRELQEDEMVAVTIYDEEIALFRDGSGQAHALQDQCPHRGARLSDGRHHGDRIACPFHGWEFGGDGRCALIPSNGPDAPIPPKARVAAYPLQERGGSVWVWVGDAERVEPLELPPELTDPSWRAVHFQAKWHAHLTRVIESILDVSHLPYVHPESFQAGERELVLVAKPFHPLLIVPCDYVDDRKPSTITFHFPNQVILRTDMVDQQVMATYITMTPVEDGGIILYGLALRIVLQDIELIDDVHYEHNVTVLDQDRPVVEGLRPRVSPLDLTREVHVRSDAQQVRYRQMVKRHLEHAPEPDPYYQPDDDKEERPR